MRHIVKVEFLFILFFALILTGCGGAMSAKISSVPKGAKVYADGEYKGETPLKLGIQWNENLFTFTENLIYPREIRVEKEGYKSITRKFSSWHKYDGFSGREKFLLEAGAGEISEHQLKNQPEQRQAAKKKPKNLLNIIEETLRPETVEDTRAPFIEVKFPVNNQIVRGDSITIKGFAFDDTRIAYVSINGRKVPLRSARDLSIVPNKSYETVQDIVQFKLKNFSLPNVGSNQIVIEVMDQKNHITRKIINVTRQDSGMQVSNVWGVVIGINQYADSRITGLKYANRDASEFYNFLKNSSGINISSERLLYLSNEDATLDKIRYALGTFLKKALKDDIVYIYFAGHGTPEPSSANDYYLLAHNSNLDSLYSTALPMEEVNKIIETRLYAKHVVLIADACHSGDIGTGRFRSVPNRSQRFFHWLDITREGRAILTASGATELSEESEKFGGGHGAFTYYLLEGLKGGADFNKDRIITIREAYEYTYRKVGEATNGDQHPELKGSFDNNLPLAVLK